LNRKSLVSILFWSVISAAFLGPGTVTTAAAAGANFKLSLLWALTFSTIATIFLQEASARITIASGYTLGEAVALKFSGKSGGNLWKWLLAGSIILGSAAYQAGNILGAISGVGLIFNADPKIFTVIIGALAGGILWFGNPQSVAKLLGIFVALMGAAFLYVAFQTSQSASDIISGALIPTFPEGSTLIVVGLIGTTIVPYNLFLGSGITKGQTIKEMRFGLIIAIILGGLISMVILISTTEIEGDFTFQTLKDNVTAKAGIWTAYLVAFGLFAAGFTSSITAPLASAITAQSVFGKDQESWRSNGLKFKSVAISVLLFGFIFGLIDVKPIPIIILAQAVNGLLLPFVAVFLLLIVNDRELLTCEHINGRVTNLITLLIVGITLFLGLNNLSKAIFSTVNVILDQNTILWLLALISTLGVIVVGVKIHNMDKPLKPKERNS